MAVLTPSRVVVIEERRSGWRAAVAVYLIRPSTEGSYWCENEHPSGAYNRPRRVCNKLVSQNARRRRVHEHATQGTASLA